MPMEARVRSFLRRLFETRQARRPGTWVVIPGCLLRASQGAWALIWVTEEVIQGMTLWVGRIPWIVTLDSARQRPAVSR